VTVSQANAVAAPGGPAGAGRKGFKAELDGLRERMRGLGLGYDEIAAEVSRRHPVRPRQAYRLAWGWTLDQAAARFNERAALEGADPQGRAVMTGAHMCEYEKWPDSMRRPSAYVLCMLAGVFETGVLCLLDLADHESLPQQDRLVLLHRRNAGTAAGVEGPALRLDPGREAGGTWEAAGGMSVTLPYVPARLVIKVSGPDTGPGLLPAGGGDREAAGGRLVLVRDGSSGLARTEAGR
jgi:hypothetical protein